MASAALTPPALVGRSAELAFLDEHFDASRVRGAALMLTG